MKIKSVELVNFGKNDHVVINPGNISVLFGENGYGKTTILNGIRYALTGAEPAGDIIKKGTDTCRVVIDLIDDSGEVHSFERLKSRTKPSKFRVDGRNTTAKSMNAKIAEIVGIDLDKIEIVSSADVVASMKPQEFGSFILNYIPKKLEISDVIGFIDVPTPGMISIMEANLPVSGIDVAGIDEFNEFCKATRKELKAQIAAKKLLLSEKPAEAPEFSEKELNDRLAELDAESSKLATYSTLLSSYNKAVETRDRLTGMISSLREEADKLATVKPNPADKAKVEEEIASAEQSLRNNEKALIASRSALKQLETTLSALEKPICPISPLITCHENKTVAKAEISESVESTKEGIAALEEETEKLKDTLKVLGEKLKAEDDKIRAYERRIDILKQIKTAEDSMPDVPVKPEKPEIEDVESERFQIKEKLKILDAYNEGRRIGYQIEELTKEETDYDKLVKATADKGEVRTGVVSAFLSVFEEIINERSMKHDPAKTFTFVAEDGVTVLMNGLKYAELSGGERAYMIFAIMDMLNVLSGARLLMADELSILDKDTFKALCMYMLEYASEYDHIFLASVDHPDLTEVTDSLGIDRDITKWISYVGASAPVKSEVEPPVELPVDEGELPFE